MRKILITGLLLLCPFSVFAGTWAENGQPTNAQNVLVNDASGTPISAYIIASGNTLNTQAIPVRDNIGYQSILVKVSGNININQQVSLDGINWYTPYTTDGATLTAVGGVVSNVTADRWIITPARLTYYTRFQISANTDSTVSFYYVYIN